MRKAPDRGIKEANAGGTAGGYLARSGIRALVIEGEAAAGRHYILYLGKNQDYQLVKVDFEVKGIYALMTQLREKYGDSISVICAGPAGMNKMRSAAVVVSDPEFNPRFAARGGLGAVMGSKGLLAVVIESPRGMQRIPADRSRFIETSRKLNRLLLENPKTGKTFREFGTTAITKVVSEIGCLPTRNFSQGSFEEVESISGSAARLDPGARRRRLLGQALHARLRNLLQQHYTRPGWESRRGQPAIRDPGVDGFELRLLQPRLYCPS